MPDLIFMHELAEHLHMTVAELCYGRGTPPSLHEVGVSWPAYFQVKQRMREHEENKARPGRGF